MKSLFTLGLLMSFLNAVCAADDPAKKPNFIVIFVDDQALHAIGYRNPEVQSPNIDKLAAGGMRFDRAFAASPICIASRASVVTGVFPQQNGTVGLAENNFTERVVASKMLVTLPMVLGQAHYHTALYGKSHIGKPTDYGYAEGYEVKAQNDEETFEQADKFLQRESTSGRPFLLWLAPHNPHVPYTVPQAYKDLYKNTDIKLAANWLETPPMESLFNQGKAGEMIFRDGAYKIYPGAAPGLTAGPPRTADNMKAVTREYFSDVSYLDSQVGHLLEQLKATKLYDNTIIIYLSDNGYNLGNHGLGNKLTMHEESVRVPFFIHSPLLPVHGAITQALTSSLDVFPTILDFAGIPIPAQLMGKSLRPVLANPEATVREYVSSESSGPPENRLGTGHRMVRTDHYKLILSVGDEEAFFDLNKDPYELNNLIANPEMAPEVARHRLMLKEWMTKVGEKRLTQEQAAGPINKDKNPKDKNKKAKDGADGEAK